MSPDTTGMSTADATLQARLRAAFTWSFPVFDLAQLRGWSISGVRRLDGPGPGVPPNRLHHSRRLLTDRDRAVTTPNSDTLYSSAWLDLAAQPLLLAVPEMHDRYYSFAFMDVFTNNFAYVGRRTTGTSPGRYVIVGPAWLGDEKTLPAHDGLIRSPSNDVWMFGRFGVAGPSDLSAVHAVQDAVVLQPVPGGAAPRAVATEPDESSPRTYLALVNEMLGRNPLPGHERAMVQDWQDLGLRPGDLQAWDRLAPETRDAWTSAYPTLRRELDIAPAGRMVRRGGWTFGASHLGRYGDDYAYRAYISLTGLGALEPVEAIYASAGSDAERRRLDGAHRYTLRVPAHLPLDAFWSLSLYEFTPDGRRFFAANAIDRFAIGDRSGLASNADGSVTLAIQHAEPADPVARANWLPAPAQGRFALTMRFYQPRDALLDGSFVLPDVERLDQ